MFFCISVFQTRVLVTHGVGFLPQVDTIVVLVDGKISEIGSYRQLLDHDGAFSQFLKNYLTEELEKEDEGKLLLILQNRSFNPYPDNLILALSKLKAFTDNNISVAQMIWFFLDRVENILGERKEAFFQHFVPFSQYILKRLLFQNKPWFLLVCSTSLLKTLWEKVILLIVSIFSISHSVLCSFGELSTIPIKFEIVVYKLFQFGRV